MKSFCIKLVHFNDSMRHGIHDAWKNFHIRNGIYDGIKHSSCKIMIAKELAKSTSVYLPSKPKCRRDYTDKLLARPDSQQSGGWIVSLFYITWLLPQYYRFSDRAHRLGLGGEFVRRVASKTRTQHDQTVYSYHF